MELRNPGAGKSGNSSNISNETNKSGWLPLHAEPGRYSRNLHVTADDDATVEAQIDALEVVNSLGMRDSGKPWGWRKLPEIYTRC